MNEIARILDNRMNPLLVRELRQLVRNRFIIVLINLFVAVMVLSCMMTVLFQDAARVEGGGGPLFGWLSFLMSVACFIAVVVYTSMTTASERINGDLMFTSAMRPSSIVFGKAWSGAVLTVLLMSMTAPFVMLAYLLRGLDIEQVASTFLNVFVSIQVMNALAICLFSNVKTKVQMSVMLILGLFAFMFVLGPMVQFFLMSRMMGMGGTVTPGWTVYVGFLLTSLALLSLLLAAATASIAPPTSNRLLPVRIVLTLIYLGSLLLCLSLPGFIATVAGSPLAPWVYGWLGALCVMCLLVVSERETWSFRIRQTIPKSWILRGLCFPFYSGSPNGLFWGGLLFGGILLAVIHSQSAHAYEDGIFFVLLFSFDYCVTALLIRSCLLRRQVTPDKTWAIVLFLVLVFTLGSLLLSFIVHWGESVHGDFIDLYSESWMSALNPFMAGDDGMTRSSFRAVVAIVWATILAPLLLLWFILRVLHFSPFDRGDAMSLEQAAEAVRRADADPLVKGKREKTSNQPSA